MAFDYFRTVHFPDTDAAGVVFFANYLALCHEAYEEALAAAGLNVREFFSDRSGVMLPVARSEAQYLRPLLVGERLRISVQPSRLTEASFALEFAIWKLAPVEKIAARVRTEHVCISTQNRERKPLSAELAAWVTGGA